VSDAENHKQKMQELQSQQREKTARNVKPDRGLVLVHTGNGKGKSSSAFGVLARALGWGNQVGVVQFIKGKWVTGERKFFDQFPEQVHWFTMGDGFTWNTQDLENDTAAAQAAFNKATQMMSSGDYDLIVLDEINIALRYDYLDVEAVIEGVDARHERTSVVLTGRDAKPALIDYADLVTEMQEIKHPFQKGINAQQGIDY